MRDRVRNEGERRCQNEAQKDARAMRRLKGKKKSGAGGEDRTVGN